MRLRNSILSAFSELKTPYMKLLQVTYTYYIAARANNQEEAERSSRSYKQKTILAMLQYENIATFCPTLLLADSLSLQNIVFMLWNFNLQHQKLVSLQVHN